ncbi:MAG: hypothetical protein J6B07_04125 [Opitutales bacterium]|nr:hypothetical protein [Opitutales bacterium]
MIKFLIVFFLSTTISFATVIRIDASSPEKLQASYEKMIVSLDDEMQQKFALAMTTIGVVMSQRADLGGSQKIMEIINGKTALEIIAESKKLTGYIRKSEKIVRAEDSATFSKSIGNMLLSLPDEKRNDFSEAIAKLMYDRENRKIPESDFLKKVNGKSADEIIEIAKDIEVPFTIAKKNVKKEYKIEKLSDSELEKMGIKRNSTLDKKNDTLDFKNSLVPPSN